MPYNVEQNGSCPDGKPFAVVGPSGKVMGCHATKPAARRQQAALYASEKSKEHHLLDFHEVVHYHYVVEDDDAQGVPKSDLHIKTPIKRENGMDFPPRDYAYVPDPLRPATWRLRLTESPGKVSLEQVQRAAAAISPAGFRGNRLEIPPAAASSVKRRLLAEFRRLKVGEADIPTSVKEVKKEDFMVWKDANERLRWFAVYSNNFRDEDNPPEIISRKSHETFVHLVDEGLVDYPELWLWHLPGTTWGKADWVAYSDGFAMAAGYVYPGFENVAEELSKYDDLRVSHGMPKPLLVYDPRYKQVTIFHVTTEISPLPGWAAANKMTGFAIIGKGDITMALPKEKKNFLQEVGLSANVIAQVEANLGRARQSAEDSGVESKELGDPDPGEDEDDTGEAEANEDADEDTDEDTGEDTDEITSKARSGTRKKGPLGYGGRKPSKKGSSVHHDDDEDEDDKGSSVHHDDDDKPRRRKRSAKKEITPEVVYVTHDEAAEAIANVISPLVQSVNALSATIKSMRKEISDLRATDEEKIAQTKEVTPTLSLTEMIMRRNPIGKEAAKVKGSTMLGKDGPTETKAPVPQATMVPLINGFIEGMYQQVSQDDES